MGLLSEYPRVRATLTAMRQPVNDPGPKSTAMISIFCGFNLAALNNLSRKRVSVSLCCFVLFQDFCATVLPFFASAMLPLSVEVVRARTITMKKGEQCHYRVKRP